MKEDITKSLIQKSTIHTSEDFTDNLLLKIEEELSRPHERTWSIQSLLYTMLVMMVGGGVYFIVVFTGFLPKLEVLDYQFYMNKTPFLVMLAFTLLIGANHVLRCQSIINDLNKS